MLVKLIKMEFKFEIEYAPVFSVTVYSSVCSVVHQKPLVQCVNMKIQTQNTIDRAVLQNTKKCGGWRPRVKVWALDPEGRL